MRQSRRQGKRKRPEKGGGLELELRRQLVHAAAGMTIVLVLVSVEKAIADVLFGLAIALLISLSLYRGHRTSIHKHFGLEGMYRLENWLEKRILEVERPGEFPLRGALFFFIGSFIAFELFPLRAAVAGILVLAISDAVSTLAGKAWGRHKLIINGGKSWEGSAAFLLSATAVLFFLVSPEKTLTVALLATIIEMMPELDDNLTVPFFTALLTAFV